MEIFKKVCYHLGGISDHPDEILSSLYISNGENIVSFIKYKKNQLKNVLMNKNDRLTGEFTHKICNQSGMFLMILVPYYKE